MPRLSNELWEKAKADYEIRGMGVRDIARQYGVSPSAVSLRVKTHNWKQSKTEHLISRKVNAIKEINDVTEQTAQQKLTLIERYAFDKEVDERLQLDGMRRSFHAKLYAKGELLLSKVDNVNDWKLLASGAKDLAPQVAAQTNVSIQQAQTQGQQLQQKTPEEICNEIIAERQKDCDIDVNAKQEK